MNFTDLLEFHAKVRGESNCIFSDNRYWTFEEVYRMVGNLSAELVSRGVKPGDVVAHTFSDNVNYLVSMFATARLGATVFGVSLKSSRLYIDTNLERVKAAWLLTDIPNLQFINLETIRVTADSMSGNPNGPVPKEPQPRAPWLIFSGSGTTGQPKLMAQTHSQLYERRIIIEKALPVTCGDHFASLIGIDFLAGKEFNIIEICNGVCVHIFPSNKFSLLDEIRKERLSAIFATVFHVEMILSTYLPADKKRFSKLKALMIGTSTVSINLRERIRNELTPQVYITYGSNEADLISVTNLEEVFTVPGNVGRPVDGCDVQIVDTQGNVLPAETPGLIRVRSSGMIDGYMGDQVATRIAFKDGWFYPRDVGKFTSDGQLIHLGRSDNMMILNGINIYPAEIEQVLNSHPEITDAFALPIAHRIHQDIPVAIVQLTAGAKTNEKTLLSFCRDRLGSSSPHRVFIAQKIPRNEQGKPVMADIRKIIASMLSH